MAKQPVPLTRGLDNEEVHGLETDVNGRIVAIKSFGNGYIVVQIEGGMKVRREGGTLAWRYNNPGNIKFGEFAMKYGAVGKAYGGHAVFPTYEMGKKAMIDLLFTPIRGYNKLTIFQAISKYAPASDGNNPTSYANFVAKACGATRDTVLAQLNRNQRERMLEAMMKMEGYKVGKVKKV